MDKPRSKPSPGPWHACCTQPDASEPHYIFANNSSMGAIFDVCHNDPSRSDFCKDYEVVTVEEAKANAILAAAAPDLLAALEDAEKFVSSVVVDARDSAGIALQEKIRAAIQRAKEGDDDEWDEPESAEQPNAASETCSRRPGGQETNTQ